MLSLTARPPEYTVCRASMNVLPPLLTVTVPPAPPLSTSIAPPESTTVAPAAAAVISRNPCALITLPLATPPDCTISNAPKSLLASRKIAPDVLSETIAVPPDSTLPLAAPPAETYSVPPLNTYCVPFRPITAVSIHDF
jgi:hypothetical protein